MLITDRKAVTNISSVRGWRKEMIRHYPKALMVLLSCLFHLLANGQVPTASGTCVIVLRTAHMALLAADTRTTVESETVTRINTCKIHVMDSVTILAAAGITESGKDFNVAGIAQQAYRPGDRITQIADRFAVLLRPALKRIAARDKRANDSLFTRRYSNKEVCQTIFVRFEDDTVKTAQRGFEIVDGGRGEISVRTVSVDCPPDCMSDYFVSYFGVHDDIRPFTEQHRSIFSDSGFVKAAALLLNMESAHHPDDVGPPYNMVMLNKDGITWLWRDPCCQENENWQNGR